MGYYINSLSNGKPMMPTGKVRQLMSDGAKIVNGDTFVPNLVCVVENGFFDAAAYCYSENEFTEFSDPSDDRRKTWLVYDHAKELSGYNK